MDGIANSPLSPPNYWTGLGVFASFYSRDAPTRPLESRGRSPPKDSKARGAGQLPNAHAQASDAWRNEGLMRSGFRRKRIGVGA